MMLANLPGKESPPEELGGQDGENERAARWAALL